jgi:hypothetical protein
MKESIPNWFGADRAWFDFELDSIRLGKNSLHDFLSPWREENEGQDGPAWHWQHAVLEKLGLVWSGLGRRGRRAARAGKEKEGWAELVGSKEFCAKPFVFIENLLICKLFFQLENQFEFKSNMNFVWFYSQNKIQDHTSIQKKIMRRHEMQQTIV